MHIRLLLPLIVLSVLSLHAQTAAPGLRDWQDQQGRTIKAAMVKLDGENVVLQMENGASATVPLSRFSAADQAFARQQATKPAGAGAASSTASSTRTWPTLVSIDKKNLQITNGEQDANTRSFVYQSGVFQFVSQAPLTGTVMRDIASDFELTSLLFKQLPWGWEPKPRNGKPFFVAKLFETEKDFIAGGGVENSSGGSVNDYIITKFTTLGLKKVGERYAFDAKLAEGGDMIGLITRLMLADMRGLCMPWASTGAEQFLEHAAYRKGAFSFTSPERAVKVWLDLRRSGGYQTDADRLVKRLKTPWSALPKEVSAVSIRIENNMDDFLLFYYFGFLDEDGKGTHLHQYYTAAAKDSLDYRRYNEAGRKGPLSWKGTFESHGIELNNQYIIAERTDDKLREMMIAKFKSVGIKL